MLRILREHTKAIMIIVILFFVASCFAGYGMYVGGARNDGAMRDYPVAEASGKKIMRSQLEERAADISAQTRREITSEDMPALRRSALENIVLQTELEKEIKERKIKVSRAETDEAFIRIADSYPTREEFMEVIKRSGNTEEKVKEDVEKQLQIQKLTASLADGITIDDKEANAFYDATKDFLYKRPAGVTANIATFTDKEAADAARKAIAGGAKWDDAIAAHSKDVEMSTPYDKPILITNQMMEQSEFAPFKKYVTNKITDVESAGGGAWYIAIKRSDAKERVLPFEEASADVRAALRDQRLREEQFNFYNMLITRADIKILDASIFPREQQPQTPPASGDVAGAASEDKK